jgi:hypothetical protein
MFQPPLLTRTRVRLAYAIAISADAVQVMLGPIGWTFADEVIDLVAMAALWSTVGFHPLLLPTFVLELVPVVDWAPTWTGCVAVVIALRHRQQVPPPATGPVIDV